MNTVRAKVNESYFRRFLFVGLALLAYGGWCTYDGMVVYPKKLVQAEAYHGMYEDGLSQDEIDKKWIEKTTEKGWKRAIPKTPKKIKDDIQMQYIQLAVCLVGAAFLLAKYFLAFGHWVESDGAEIRASYSSPIAISDVQKIDKTKWEKKGIAKIHHSGGVFVLDDFKYDRESMGKILIAIEDTLEDNQIEGGDRESKSKSTEDKA